MPKIARSTKTGRFIVVKTTKRKAKKAETEAAALREYRAGGPRKGIKRQVARKSKTRVQKQFSFYDLASTGTKKKKPRRKKKR